jgi:FkbM family methyltransferase
MFDTLNKLIGEAIFTIKGCKFLLSPASYIDRQLIKKGGFDERITLTSQIALKAGGIFIDIGANFGYYSVLAATLPGVSVMALEPSPREMKRLQTNITLNGFKNIKAMPIAAAATKGIRRLHLAPVSNAGMNSFSPAFTTDDSVAVTCARVDDLLQADEYRQVKMIKIDVEGAEYDVLQGMPELLKNFDGILACEISPGTDHGVTNRIPEIYTLMKEKGFDCLYGMETTYQYDEFFFKPGEWAIAMQELEKKWSTV